MSKDYELITKFPGIIFGDNVIAKKQSKINEIVFKEETSLCSW